MKIKIDSVHFDADAKLLDFINLKIAKLNQLFDFIVGFDVTLKTEKVSDEKNKVVEIKAEVPGNDLFVKKQCKTFEEAVDTSIDALKIQLNKHKDKLRGK